MNQIKIGRFISNRRKALNFTQNELAKKLGISNRAVSKWETGKSMPDVSIMIELCEILNITVNELLCGKELTVTEEELESKRNVISMIMYKNKYLSFKIKVKYLLATILIITIGVCVYGYYDWCKYHPDISIKIMDSSAGIDGLNLEAPHIAYSAVGIAEPDESILLKIDSITDQHNFVIYDLISNYISSDIKLDYQVNDNLTILNYYGSAVDKSGKKVEYKNIIKLDFKLNATVIK